MITRSNATILLFQICFLATHTLYGARYVVTGSDHTDTSYTVRDGSGKEIAANALDTFPDVIQVNVTNGGKLLGTITIKNATCSLKECLLRDSPELEKAIKESRFPIPAGADFSASSFVADKVFSRDEEAPSYEITSLKPIHANCRYSKDPKAKRDILKPEPKDGCAGPGFCVIDVDCHRRYKAMRKDPPREVSLNVDGKTRAYCNAAGEGKCPSANICWKDEFPKLKTVKEFDDTNNYREMEIPFGWSGNRNIKTSDKAKAHQEEEGK